MSKKIKASVYGATGFAGREILKILTGHRKIQIDRIYSKSHAGKNISNIFPSLKGKLDMVLELPSPETVQGSPDAVFLSLPHKKSMKYIPGLISKGILTVDMSADYRFSDFKVYEKQYNCRHTDRDNLGKAVYGLPEINRKEIKKARLIANPGCYATAVILAVYPLLKERILKESVFVDAKSGISGAGKKLHDEYLFARRYENITPYKVDSHRHIKEITGVLSKASGVKWESLVFCPHLIPVERGILANIYAQTGKKISYDTLKDIYRKYYKSENFINIYSQGQFPQTSDTVGTNNCGLGLAVSQQGNSVIVITSIDNLIKGAAGQAVQNLNIAMGFEEFEGLR